MPIKHGYLKNGIKYIINHNKCFKTVVLKIIVKTGAHNETHKSLFGISHFLEHMFFKATKKRRTSYEIDNAVSKYGAIFNASTSYNITDYYVQIGGEHTGIAIDVMSDIFFESLFLPKDIESEKNVVYNELLKTVGLPFEIIEKEVNSLIYKNTTLNHSICGDKQSIFGFNRNMIMAYIEKYYIPENICISICGNFSIKKHFANFIKAFSKPIPYKSPSKIPICIKERNRVQDTLTIINNFNGTIRHINKKMHQSYLCMMFYYNTEKTHDKFIAELITIILCDGMSSILMHELRVKRGLVYGIKAYPCEYDDHNIFRIECGTNNKENIVEIINVITNELNNLKKGKNISDLVKTGKTQVLGILHLSEDNLRSASSIYGHLYLDDNIVGNIDKYYKTITPNDVMEFSKRWFLFENSSTVIVY